MGEYFISKKEASTKLSASLGTSNNFITKIELVGLVDVDKLMGYADNDFVNFTNVINNNQTEEPPWAALKAFYMPRTSGHILQLFNGDFVMRDGYEGNYSIRDKNLNVLKAMGTGTNAGDSYNQTRPSGCFIKNLKIDGIEQGDCALFRNWYYHFNIITHLEDYTKSEVYSTSSLAFENCPDVNQLNNTFLTSGMLLSNDFSLPPLDYDYDLSGANDWVFRSTAFSNFTSASLGREASIKSGVNNYNTGSIYFGENYIGVLGSLGIDIYSTQDYDNNKTPNNNVQAFIRRIPPLYSSSWSSPQGQSINIYEDVLILLAGYASRSVYAVSISTGKLLATFYVGHYTWNRLHWKYKIFTVGQSGNQARCIEFDPINNTFSEFL